MTWETGIAGAFVATIPSVVHGSCGTAHPWAVAAVEKIIKCVLKDDPKAHLKSISASSWWVQAIFDLPGGRQRKIGIPVYWKGQDWSLGYMWEAL